MSSASPRSMSTRSWESSPSSSPNSATSSATSSSVRMSSLSSSASSSSTAYTRSISRDRLVTARRRRRSDTWSSRLRISLASLARPSTPPAWRSVVSRAFAAVCSSRSRRSLSAAASLMASSTARLPESGSGTPSGMMCSAALVRPPLRRIHTPSRPLRARCPLSTGFSLICCSRSPGRRLLMRFSSCFSASTSRPRSSGPTMSYTISRERSASSRLLYGIASSASSKRALSCPVRSPTRPPICPSAASQSSKSSRKPPSRSPFMLR
mmetsp:Transcript_65857/g.208422  ORF Transcript_65857/g.208422 Transcript_65857/m.208422 type:complete len:267 (-) Transcript_65857:749-1549(-)